MHGYSRTYRTSFVALAGFCFALFSLSALGQQLPPGQGVSVDWSPTTSHWQTNSSTIRTPPGVTTSPSTSVGPVVRTPSGGASQPMGSGITITSIQRTAPLSSQLNAGLGALRTAVTRCLTNIPCTLAVTAATIGLQELLDRSGMGIDDSGTVVTQTVPEFVPETYNATHPLFPCPVAQGDCISGGGFEIENDGYFGWYCPRRQSGSGQEYNLVSYFDRTCYYVSNGELPNMPASPAAISDAVDQHYSFDPSDWPVIGPHIPLGSADVEIEITSAPTLITPPVTTTVYDSNGVPHSVTETNIEVQLTPRAGTNPGKKPAMDMTETETTTVSDSTGTVTGTTTTVTTKPAGDTTPDTSTGGGSPPAGDWPGFCDWASVICNYPDWTKEGWDGEEPELPQLIDFDPDAADYQVGGPGACPAPYPLHIGWMLNTTLQISYQPFCDFGAAVRPLFLAFCYLFAAVITVRSL